MPADWFSCSLLCTCPGEQPKVRQKIKNVHISTGTTLNTYTCVYLNIQMVNIFAVITLKFKLNNFTMTGCPVHFGAKYIFLVQTFKNIGIK